MEKPPVTWLAVWSALKRVPRQAWGFLLGVTLLAAVYAFHLNRVHSAYAAGKRAAAQGVVFDSAMLARAAERVAKQTAHTDTVVERVTVTRWRVESLTVALPPEVRVLPPVDTLVRVTQSLLTQVDSLGTAITAERAAWTERAKVDSAAIYALRVIATAQADTIRTLNKRPRWRTVLGAVAVGVVGGMVAR